jgi:RNA polymerase sigma-70 factor (ECF subfamily)
LTRAEDDNARWGALLASAQRGDRGDYRRFLEAITPFVRSVARRRSGDEERAEDVVQDALITLHRIRHTYTPGRPVKPWIAAIVARRAIDAARREGRIAGAEVEAPLAYETFADPAANQEESGEARHLLERMLPELSPREKEAVELVKLRELSLAEASEQSGQSVGALKVNVHRAIARMRKLAAERGWR